MDDNIATGTLHDIDMLKDYATYCTSAARLSLSDNIVPSTRSVRIISLFQSTSARLK